ncbi:MAG: GLPGLI family protein [Spirosomaceae bacterium]|jgi:GLPGLI family protein|nr:GLPGLI family protein [Spirosomataceae bacterium]
MKTIHYLLKTACCLLLVTYCAHGQTAGKITYDYKYSWTKVTSRLSFLSKEEKDRMMLTSKQWEDRPGIPMKLVFDETQSIYTYAKEQGESEDGQWTWRQDDYLIHRNFDQQKQIEHHEMLGKTFLLEDSLQTFNWRIQNQIKDVGGYVCMKAETFDAIKNQKITAWFAQDIPVGVGPERYSGLPGAILELDLNDGDVVVTATKIELKAVPDELKLPKMKGKKITNNDYNQLIKKHIFESIKAQRNPYWAMRY